jgi:hypothetical protein
MLERDAGVVAMASFRLVAWVASAAEAATWIWKVKAAVEVISGKPNRLFFGIVFAFGV